MEAAHIKVDGVSLNVAFVKGLSRANFIKHPQVRALFYRIAEDKKDEALSTIYTAITGKERKGAGGAAKSDPAEGEATPAEQ